MRVLLTAILLLALSLGAACGGGDDDDSSGDGDNETPSAQDDRDRGGGDSGDSGDGADGDGDSGGGGSDDSDSSSEFASLAGLFGQRDYVVTFTIETRVGAETFSGEWTWYRDVEGERSRFDLDTEAGGEVVSATFITTPDEVYFCSEANCLAFPSGAQSPFPNPSIALTEQVSDIDDRVLGGSVQDAGTRTIAGIEARCFTFDVPGSGIAEGESCVSAEGVPVLTKWEGDEGSFRLEATSYSSEVSDEDFEPPFPVTRLPSN